MHKKCFVCGRENCSGLGIRYGLNQDGNVKGSFFVAKDYQDNTGSCHRGIILTLLDSVMVHTMLQRNIKGLTGTLDVKFVKPIPVGTKVNLLAKISGIQKNLYITVGKVYIGEEVFAEGKGKFLKVAEDKPVAMRK